jgi:hypothetical protein
MATEKVTLILPEELMDAVRELVPRGGTSKFIAEAVTAYIESRRHQTLREHLKAGYLANAEADQALAEEQRPLEEEAWERVDQTALVETLAETITPDRIEWMIENAPAETLPKLTHGLLQEAARACQTRNWEPLAELILSWEATIEELSLGPAHVQELLKARDEVRCGEGLSWNELWTSLER